MTEARIAVSPTGGRKGRKDAELGNVDPKALLVLAAVAGKGAEKYGDPYNFLKGYDWSLSFNAMQRHALAFWSGEDTDPESGLPHMGHVAWHALALVSFLTRGLGTDDRFKQDETDFLSMSEFLRNHPLIAVPATVCSRERGRAQPHPQSRHRQVGCRL